MGQGERGGPTRGYGGTGKVSAPRSAVDPRPLSAICDPDPSTFPSSRTRVSPPVPLLSSPAPSQRGLRGNDPKLRGRLLIAHRSARVLSAILSLVIATALVIR
jgi:hypothetical protein